jgi:hypothetical protein
MVVLIIVLAVLASVVADIVFFVWWFKRLRGDALREVVGEEKVYHVEDCNFFGRQSSGYRQWRGNGVIALTDRGVHFRMFLPRKEVFVALDSVAAISQPRTFLGKSKARELLRVDFVDEAGEEDACAWLVRSLQWWIESLEALKAGREPPPAPSSDRG